LCYCLDYEEDGVVRAASELTMISPVRLATPPQLYP